MYFVHQEEALFIEVMADNKFYDAGLRFSCTQCAACCRGEPGYVFLSQADISRLADFLKKETGDVVKKYCRTVNMLSFSRLSLLDSLEFDCVFWEARGCSVYPARPLQCRTYPFWPAVLKDRQSWQKESGKCPGMDQGMIHTRNLIREYLLQRDKEPLIKVV